MTSLKFLPSDRGVHIVEMHLLWQSSLLWLFCGLGVVAAAPEADNKNIKSIPVAEAISS